MSAENISYDLKRFAGIKRDYTPDGREIKRLDKNRVFNVQTSIYKVMEIIEFRNLC